MARLVLLTPPVPYSDGRIQMTDKTLSGLTAFRERWPGPVHVIARPVVADPSGNLGAGWLDLDDAPVSVHLGDTATLLATVRPDIIQAHLTLVDQPAGRSDVPVVIVAENPSLERLRYARTTTPGRRLPRMVLGAARQEFALRRVVRDAQSLACNGWAAWESYGASASRHTTRPLLFFDTRLRAKHMVKPSGVHRSRVDLGSPTNEMRLAFSGRFHPAKGVQHAVAAAHALEARGFAHRLSLVGAGPLESALRERAGRTVQFLKPMAFDPTWIEYVRSSVDIMVLPHVQGDPSGTYLEAAGLSVPTIGFHNRALSGHVRNIGLGWAVRTGDVDALATRIEEVAGRPDDIEAAGQRGSRFMADHTMELEFDRRVEHLLETLHESRGH